ncbi:MAG: hypothetical protein N3D16_01590 [Anaerolineales bacterium]|nr:hypothetical protein [Anaerolineales bacterium]
MPPQVEVCSELAVAFGILGVHPQEVTGEDRLRVLFYGNRPTWREFVGFRNVFGTMYDTDVLWDLGRRVVKDWIGNLPKQVEWYGPSRQARTTSASRDLRLHGVNWSVSVKYKSDVVSNSSPYNLFEAVASGFAKAKGASNWFEAQSPMHYERLVKCAVTLAVGRGVISPQEVEACLADPSLLNRVIDKIGDDYKRHCRSIYIAMCRDVAKKSAELFNRNLESVSRKSLTGVYEGIIRQFLRVNGERYLLVGIEKDNTAYALEIPSIDDVRKAYRIEHITAAPDLARQQSVVNFDLCVANIGIGSEVSLEYHAEIRWSHGPFCGNPEAKLYKEFGWAEVPFFKVIYNQPLAH